MKVPLEISYRDIEKTDAIDTLVREKAAKLEEFHGEINSCRVALEKEHGSPDSGSPYRVRIDLRVPPSHELAVTKNPEESTQYVELETVIREAFEAARKQLVKLNEQQQGEVKEHLQEEMAAVVSELFPEQGYGFLRSLQEEQIYFHRNSVLHNDFDRLEVGTGVQCLVEEGEQGSQASTVRIVS
ncbi:MAG: DNA-binding protein [Cyanobacteria bacterium QS_4_48_99]|nr:MAG: DNA-binding protein [Cyanobacteria bacterium QS_4_48_99]